MCRHLDQGGRRCSAHSPENRQAVRYEAALDETFEGWLEALAAQAELLALEAAGEPAALEAALSVWIAAWRDLMVKIEKAVATLDARREKAKSVRVDRDQERSDAVQDKHRQELAETAVRKADAAIQALYAVQAKQRGLQLMAALDAAAVRFGTQHELVQRALEDAASTWGVAHDEAERLRLQVTDADLKVRTSGPRKGLPGASMTVFLDAQRRERFLSEQHVLIRNKLGETPTQEATLRMLSALTEAVAVGTKFAETCRQEKDAALALGRPRKVVLEPEVTLIQLPTADELLTEAA